MKRLVSRNSSDSTFPSSFTTKSCSIVMHTLSTNLLVATFQYAWVGLDVGVVCTAGFDQVPTGGGEIVDGANEQREVVLGTGHDRTNDFEGTLY